MIVYHQIHLVLKTAQYNRTEADKGSKGGIQVPKKQLLILVD
jgi:hypothetical protein